MMAGLPAWLVSCNAAALLMFLELDDDMRQMVLSDVVLGEAIPFSICDDRGRLLLRHGTVINIPDQVERLMLRGAVIKFPGEDDKEAGDTVASRAAAASRPIAVDKQPVFSQMEGLILNLRHIFTTLLKSPEQIDLPARTKALASSLQALVQEDIDSALAAPYLDHQSPYIIVHHVMGAVLTDIIAARKGLSPTDRLPYVCAALTRDVGQLSIQSQLDQSTSPLPETLKKAMQDHPLQGCELLQRAGVGDSDWLDSVLHHHERLDGSGYPFKVANERIRLGARILAISDVYSAMGRVRPYRAKAHHPQSALRDIYLKKDSHLDGELTQLLIKDIGLLPPGSLVKLKCGEISVVRKRTLKAEGATVFSVYDQRGMPMIEPLRRETHNPGCEITGMVPFAECKSAAILIKRLWLK